MVSEFRLLVRALINSTLSLMLLAVCLMLSWRALSETNFFFSQIYEYNGIEEQIDKFGPQNRNRNGFETTTKLERVKIFGEIVRSVNNGGKGLKEIVYRDTGGKIIDTFLTQPEIDHLNDVARLIGHFSRILSYLAAILGVLVMAFWICKVWKNIDIWTPYTIAKSFLSMLTLLLFCCGIVLAVGPQRVFYSLHEWVFAGMAPWHFYFQDSLMTMLTEPPLFGSISILLLVSTFVIWVLLSAVINKILS